MKRAVALMVVGMCAGHGYALKVVSHSVAADNGKDRFLFTLVFDRPPDFYRFETLPGDNPDLHRQADSFQFNIDLQNESPFQWGLDDDTVIRGEEIHRLPRTDLGPAIIGNLPIRSAGPPSADPTSGGWGDVNAVVPFLLIGPTMIFAADTSAIGTGTVINPSQGVFSYRLEAYEYGEMTDGAWGRSSHRRIRNADIEAVLSPAPEPSALMLLMLAWGALLRRKPHRADIRR